MKQYFGKWREILKLQKYSLNCLYFRTYIPTLFLYLCFYFLQNYSVSLVTLKVEFTSLS